MKMDDIVPALRRRRRELGLSTRVLAERAGVSADNLRRIETRYQMPTLPILLALCDALGLELALTLKSE
jgi:transcriptional regulator with XRE-family HTH domain